MISNGTCQTYTAQSFVETHRRSVHEWYCRRASPIQRIPYRATQSSVINQQEWISSCDQQSQGTSIIAIRACSQAEGLFMVFVLHFDRQAISVLHVIARRGEGNCLHSRLHHGDLIITDVRGRKAIKYCLTVYV